RGAGSAREFAVSDECPVIDSSGRRGQIGLSLTAGQDRQERLELLARLSQCEADVARARRLQSCADGFQILSGAPAADEDMQLAGIALKSLAQIASLRDTAGWQRGNTEDRRLLLLDARQEFGRECFGGEDLQAILGRIQHA